jgi:putative transcriptional regulator
MRAWLRSDAHLLCLSARTLRGAKAPFAALLALLIFAFGLAAAFIGAAAQTKTPPDQSGDKEGSFLVARRGLADPLFAKSIVLMLPIEDPLVVVGLIVNKPTHISLHQVFPDSPALRKNDAAAYFGGPVDIHDSSAVFRSPTPPKDALQVFGDVYVTFDSKSIVALLEHPPASGVRVFLGRAQWGHAQLQSERLRGSWDSLRSGADPIFSSHPDDVWRTLLDRIEPRPYVDYRPPSALRSQVHSSML